MARHTVRTQLRLTIEEEYRIYGDGVNIAARLESLAEPGGICVSKTAFDQIQTKLPFGCEFLLSRGDGHARAGTIPAGVNGLHDMGDNVWEWVDEPVGASGNAERRTRGGSWWYGAAQLRADHLQGKPGETTLVYIGFRCVRQP